MPIVVELATVDLIDLDDVKAHLDIDLDEVDAARDTEMQAFLEAAVEVVEGIVGPITARSYTETHYGRSGGPIFLHHGPVLAIQALGTSSYAYTVGDLTVTYTAGRATVPAAIRLAVLELVRLHYTGSQGGYRPGYGTPEDEGTRNPIGFYVPGKVLELLEPYRLGPAIA